MGVFKRPNHPWSTSTCKLISIVDVRVGGRTTDSEDGWTVMQAVVDGHMSSFHKINTGVAKGPVIALTVFLTHFNNISNIKFVS